MEEKLPRVPFTRDEEQTIRSMARWMRFMAIVGIIGGILILVLLVLGLGLLAAGWELGQTSAKWAEVKRFTEQAGPALYVMLAAFLVMAIAALCQNFALYRAGDDFELVAQTDVADVDYLAAGLDKLRTFFKIQVMIVVVTMVVVLCTALAMVALIHHAH